MLNTEIKLPPAFWNAHDGFISEDLPPEFGDADELNNHLRQMYRPAEDLVIFATKRKLPNPGEFVKKTFHPQFDSSSLKDIAKDLESRDVKTNLDLFFSDR